MDIKFKAKRKDNNEWVYGYYWTWPRAGKHYIRIIDKDTENIIGDTEIDENTLCLYTGLIDKNGIEIYEDDKVYYKNWNQYGKIVFEETIGMFLIKFDNNWCDDFDHVHARDLEVIEE